MNLFEETYNVQKAARHESFYRAAQEMDDADMLMFYKALDACRFRGIILDGMNATVQAAFDKARAVLKEGE